MDANDVEKEILRRLYKKYFENYLIGISHRNIANGIDFDENEIAKILDKITSEYLIELKGTSYIITTDGIERFEQIEDPSEVNENITQRQQILNELKNEYDTDISKKLNNDELAQKIGSQDRMHLLSQVTILEQIGMVDLEMSLGGTFGIKLNANGAKLFENIETGIAEYNETGFIMLFKLENHLRKFIERKLKERHGSSWWNDGVLQSLREKANSRKTAEVNHSWEISITSSDLEYLEFPDLGRIIIHQWEIFEPIFSDQQSITTKFGELEKIRNAIAHSRTLSGESFTRLSMYSEEIFKMTN